MALFNQKRRGSPWVKWGLVVFGMVGIGLGWGVIQWVSSPTVGSLPRVTNAKESPHADMEPLLQFASAGWVVIPIRSVSSQTGYGNVAVVNMPQQTRRLLFDEEVLIRHIRLFEFQSDYWIELVMANEDSNGDGELTEQDIHQIVWIDLLTQDVVKIEQPRVSVIKPTGSGRFLMSSSENREYCRTYQVAVDGNGNGQWDEQDGLQVMVVSVADRDIMTMLPAPELPAQTPVTGNRVNKKRVDD